MRRGRRGLSVRAAIIALTLVAALVAATPAAAALSSETVAARKHFFGSENVAADGTVRDDRLILSWFSVASFAMAMDGHVVLLDSYIHKGEDQPGYVPTTTTELIALKPEAIFIGHGHFDHGKNAGIIAARTGAAVIGTPEHCDQAVAEAAREPVRIRCVAAVARGSAPGAEVRELTPLGSGIGVSALKHIHSAAEPPDGEGHETSLTGGGLPDSSALLLHPPGPSLIGGLNPSGDEGGTVLYQFRARGLSLVWHDSAGPLRTQARNVLDLLRRLPATDIELGATLGFNDPTNGMRDPVDYFQAIRPRYFFPHHHDFVAEYGASRGAEGVFRREAAKRGPLPGEIRWLVDPYDYLRPSLITFDLAARPVPAPGPRRMSVFVDRLLLRKTIRREGGVPVSLKCSRDCRATIDVTAPGRPQRRIGRLVASLSRAGRRRFVVPLAASALRRLGSTSSLLVRVGGNGTPARTTATVRLAR